MSQEQIAERHQAKYDIPECVHAAAREIAEGGRSHEDICKIIMWHTNVYGLTLRLNAYVDALKILGEEVQKLRASASPREPSDSVPSVS